MRRSCDPAGQTERITRRRREILLCLIPFAKVGRNEEKNRVKGPLSSRANTRWTVAACSSAHPSKKGTKKKKGTKTNLADVSDDDLSDKDLAALAPAQDGELVLALDAALQSAKLSLLGIIIEGSYQDDDDDGYQNGEALDPLVRLVLRVAQLI